MSPEQPFVAVPPQTRAGSMTARRATPLRDPVPVLVAALDAAIATLASAASVGHALEAMLATFADTVAPVQADIEVLAAREPDGALRIARGYLDNAFAHAVAGDAEATRAALITARAALFHLGGGDEDGDGDWRF